MENENSFDGAPAPRSIAATLALAGVGLVSAGNRRIGRAVGVGRRTTLAVGAPVWRSAPIAPVRRAGGILLGSLVAEGGRHELRWRAELGTTVAERLVDRVTGAMVEHAVIERVAAQLLEAGTLERVTEPIAARVVESPDLDRVVGRVLASPALDELIAKLLDSPSTDRVVAQMLASPGLERLVVKVMESRLVDDLTDQVLASDELQRVVSHIAQSPELRAAIAEQSVGLAGELADQVRARTVVADERAERAARRLLRRKPIARMGPPEPPSPAGATPG
jgi:hypothetical protein